MSDNGSKPVTTVPANTKTAVYQGVARFRPLFARLDRLAEQDVGNGMMLLAAAWVRINISECVKEAVKTGWGPHHEAFFDVDNDLVYKFCAVLDMDLRSLHEFVADTLDSLPFLGAAAVIEIDTAACAVTYMQAEMVLQGGTIRSRLSANGFRLRHVPRQYVPREQYALI